MLDDATMSLDDLIDKVVWASCSRDAGPGSLAAARDALKEYVEKRVHEMWLEREGWKRTASERGFALQAALNREADLRSSSLTSQEAAEILEGITKRSTRDKLRLISSEATHE